MNTTEPQSSTRSRSQKLGCASLVLVMVGGILLVAIATWRINRQVATYEARFAGETWTRLDGPTIELIEPITQQTLIFGSDIELHGATVDIAILGGAAELHGEYLGTVHFLGRSLDLAPDGVIKGTLEIAGARHVSIRGDLKGEPIGVWDRLFLKQKGSEPAPGESR
ncbi:MAG: hypothetical protein P8I91_07230 [Phycisphaerales bacterium]|nr:hypothetical protein [Phycisphaerales bacterium]